jgi:hypothetical protein
MALTAASGLRFVRITEPSDDEAEWARKVAQAVNGAILVYLGDVVLGPAAVDEVDAAAHRSFGYAWKYREAPFGEAQWSDEQGAAIRLAEDWLEPIKPILNRYRDVTGMIG